MNRAVCALVTVTAIVTGAAAGQEPGDLVATQDLLITAGSQRLAHTSWLGVAHDGAIVVLEPAQESVRFFHADGADAGRVGGDGAGTGEFRFVGQAGWVGDTLWINDPGLHRLTLIGPDHRLVRAMPWDMTPAMADGSANPLPAWTGLLTPIPLALYGNGEFLIQAVFPQGFSAPPPWHEPADAQQVVLRVSPHGIVRSVVGWTRNTPAACVRENIALPFCPRDLTAIAADGSVRIIVTASIAGHDSGQVTVTCIHPQGDTVFSRRIPFAAVPVSARDMDSVLASAAKPLPPGTGRDRIGAGGVSAQPPAELEDHRARALDILRSYHPTVYPPTASVFVGRDSTIWIEMRPDSARKWLILDPAGQPVAHLTVPLDVRLKAGDLTTAWGTVTDGSSDDIVRFSLRHH